MKECSHITKIYRILWEKASDIALLIIKVNWGSNCSYFKCWKGQRKWGRKYMCKKATENPKDAGEPSGDCKGISLCVDGDWILKKSALRGHRGTGLEEEWCLFVFSLQGYLGCTEIVGFRNWGVDCFWVVWLWTSHLRSLVLSFFLYR